MYSWHFNFLNVDVWPKQPVGMSPISKRISQQFDIAPYQEGVDNEEEIAQNLEGLTKGIDEPQKWVIIWAHLAS